MVNGLSLEYSILSPVYQFCLLSLIGSMGVIISSFTSSFLRTDTFLPVATAGGFNWYNGFYRLFLFDYNQGWSFFLPECISFELFLLWVSYIIHERVNTGADH